MLKSFDQEEKTLVSVYVVPTTKGTGRADEKVANRVLERIRSGNIADADLGNIRGCRISKPSNSGGRFFLLEVEEAATEHFRELRGGDEGWEGASCPLNFRMVTEQFPDEEVEADPDVEPNVQDVKLGSK